MDFLFDLKAQLVINEFLQNSFLSRAHIFFLFLSWLDTTPYYLTLCGLIRVSLKHRVSTRYVYLLSFMPFLASYLKDFFKLPRPGHYNPELDFTEIGPSLGFPSGAAMGAVVIGALIFRHSSSQKGKIFALLYIFLMSLSRLYLGAHFFVDVIAGLFFGGLVWLFYLILEKKLLSLKSPLSGFSFFFFTFVGLSSMHLALPTESTWDLILMLSGFSLGVFFMRDDFSVKRSFKNYLILIIGLLLTFSLTEAPYPSVKILGLIFIGFWLSSGCLLTAHYFDSRESS